MSENKNSIALKVVNGAFSALAPLIILTVVYAIAGIFPFGDTLLLCEHNSDWFTQLTHYHAALTGDESMFFTFSGGLGSDFYTAFSSGFCNPFWLLTGLYSAETLHGSVSVIMLIQSAVAGVFAYAMFSKICREQNLAAVVFAAAYSGGSLFALGFLAPQYSGAAVFLPLVGIGVLTLCESGSFIALFLSMTLFLVSAADAWPCLLLFCAMFFVWGMLVLGDKALIGTRVALLIVSAGLSLGSLMIILLPGWLTRVELDAAITPVSQIDHASFTAIVSALFPGGFSGSECAPLIYCSSMVLLLLPVYFFNSQLSLGERQISGISLLFTLVCMAVPSLGWLWLGSAAPTGIVVGMSFVFCLMACAFAARSLSKSVSGNVRLIMTSWLIVLGLFLLTMILRWGEASLELMLFSAASLTLFAAVSLIVLSSKKVTAAFCIVMLFCVCAESILGGFFTFTQSSDNLSLMTTEEYSLRRQERKWIDGTVASCENALPSPFFRVRGARSDSSYYVGSSENGTPRAESLMNALGINNGRGYTPFTDALFGIRYVVTGGASEYVYPLVGSDENGAVYMNNASMALGFTAPNNITALSSFSANPFTAQNELATALAGAPRQLFNNADLLSCTGIGATVSETLTGAEIIRYEQTAYVRFSLLVPADGMLYMYIDCDSESEELAQLGNHVTSVTLGSVSQLGYVSRGQTVDVYVTVKDERLVLDGMYFSVLDSVLCSAALEEFSLHQPSQLAVKGCYVRGTINVPEGDVLVTSIPYMSGWRAMVDGVSVKTAMAGGALLAVEIPSGEHTFELWYDPNYFTISLVISMLCFALGMVYACVAELLRRKHEAELRRAEEAALAEGMYSDGYDDTVPAYIPEPEYIPSYSNDGVDAEYAAAVDMTNPQFLPQTGYANEFYSEVSAGVQEQLYMPMGMVAEEFPQIDPTTGYAMPEYMPGYTAEGYMPQYQPDYSSGEYLPEFQSTEYLPDEYYPDALYDPYSGFMPYQQIDADDEPEEDE